MKAAYGVSTKSEPSLAVAEAVAEAQKKLGERAVFAQYYVGADYDPEAIAQAFARELGELPAIGCSTDGEITGAGLSVDSVCVLLVAARAVRAEICVIEQLGRDSREAGRSLALRLKRVDARVLFVLPDGLTGNGSAVIHGALEVLGRDFVIAGGTAGDRGRFQQTVQFARGKVYRDALVGMMLYSPSTLEVGFGVMSGWRPMGLARQVTRAEGNTVFTIDGETALEVYARFLGDKADQLPAIGVEYPFALVDERGRVGERGIRSDEEYLLLRAPMSVNRKDGSINFAGEMPQGAKVKMTRTRSEDIVTAAREAAQRAMARLSGPPDLALFFSCMARKIVLGRRTQKEIDAAQQVLGSDTPLFGFYTYGEIANCGEQAPMCRFHNETATFLLLRERR